jgi:hypothetical protein
MSIKVDDRIEDELRAAFRAAAAGVRPQSRPLPAADPHRAARRGSASRRWLMPAVAAAVVAAIGVPLLAVSLLRGPVGPDIGAASAVTVSAGRASVAGISFPLPAGWTARTVGSTDTSVTVCVAATRAPSCDGVALRIAVPDGDGKITPVPDPVIAEADDGKSSVPGTPLAKPQHATCPLLVDFSPIGGRPAVHYSIGLCDPGSPQSAAWFVTDGSLAISTPRGVASAEATEIATGIDFSDYRHAYGPQIAFFSEPGVASYPGPTPPTR